MYPLGKTPWPAHPNTLSYVEVVFADEVTDADRAGKETPLQALKRLPPETRTRVLGKGKAQLLEAGSLTQGMIKTPLAKVRARLDVQVFSPEAQRLRTETRQAAPRNARNAFQPTRATQRIAQVVNDIIPSAEARAAAGRAAWGDFPRVNILAALGDLRKHPRYAEAKAGDYTAAYDIVRDIEARAERPWAQVLREQVRRGPSRIGAGACTRSAGCPARQRVAERVGHGAWRRTRSTGGSQRGADGCDEAHRGGRLVAPGLAARLCRATCSAVPWRHDHRRHTDPGRHLGQPAWLAGKSGRPRARRRHPDRQEYSATLSIQPDTLTALRGRYAAIENWWIATFGYGFDRLTESEGRYLVKSGATTDQVRSRIAASRQAAGL